MSKQTSVEWLVEQLSKDQYIDHIPAIIELAKKKEKDLMAEMVEKIFTNYWRILHPIPGNFQWIGGEGYRILTTYELIEKYLK